MTGERPAGGKQPPPEDITPPEYRSGFGAEGVKALQAFVQNGGTLVDVRPGRRPADSALRSPGAQHRRRSAVRRSSGRRVDAARALRRHRSDRLRHAGRRPRALHAGSQVYEVTSMDRSQDVDIIATYVERDILQSGWLLGEQVIAKKAAAVTVKLRRRQSRAARLPPAASRSDARHIQARVQRAAERTDAAARTTTTQPSAKDALGCRHLLFLLTGLAALFRTLAAEDVGHRVVALVTGVLVDHLLDAMEGQLAAERRGEGRRILHREPVDHVSGPERVNRSVTFSCADAPRYGESGPSCASCSG